MMGNVAEIMSRVDSAALSGPAFRAFVRIADIWELSVSERLILLGGVSKSTYQGWKSSGDPKLSFDQLERISYILGIYKALQYLFPEPNRADAWIKKPNAASLFGGMSALDYMLQGSIVKLYNVRSYLDAQRGGMS